MTVNHLEILKDQGAGFFLVKNTCSGRYVRLGRAETGYLLDCLQKGNMKSQLNAEGELPEDSRQILDEKFHQWGFLDANAAPEHIRKHLDLTRIKLIEFNVEKFTKRICPIYSKFFSRQSLAVFFCICLGCAGIAIYSILNAAFGDPAAVAMPSLTLSLTDIVITVLLLLVSMAAHELAHAAVCVKYGGQVKSMGLLLFFLIPCFYCDVTDIYRIKDRKHRQRVALAGVYVNAFLGAAFLLAAFLFTLFGTVILPLYYFAVSSLAVSVYNLIPLVKLDGYWYLSASLDVTNLMDKGVLMAYTTFFHRKELSTLSTSAGKRRLLALYGIAAFLFKPLFWGYNLYEICTRLPLGDNLRWLAGCIGLAIVLADFFQTLMHDAQLIHRDYRRLIQML